MVASNSIPIEFMRERLDYDAETGVFTWRRRPRERFATQRAFAWWDVRCAGRCAGSLDRGYVVIQLRYDGKTQRIRAHRIAWALATGACPADQIDHRNGDGATNRLGNVRKATQSENCQNQKLSATNTSGFARVSWHKQKRKWRASIRVGGRSVHLGLFDVDGRESAYRAYLAAKAILHPFQPIPGNGLVLQ